MNTNMEEALTQATASEAAIKQEWRTRRSELRHQMKQNEIALLEAQANKRDAVIEARHAGMPVARIAKITGLTRQRVYQIIAAG
jgi:K+-transporting ATPase c subunit